MESSEQDSRLSAIIHSSEDAIISRGLDGVINSWNPAAERIFGYSSEEVIGNNISMIIPEELHGEELGIIDKIQEGEKIQHFQTSRKRKNGEQFPVAVTISPVRDSLGNVTGISSIIRDITEQKISDEKQSRLAAIIDSSDDAIVSKDLNGMIKSWNAGAERIFGYTEEEAIGKHISLIIPKHLMDEETHIISKIRSGEKVSHFETVRVRKDGKEINISLTVSPVRDRYNQIIGASKIARDITDRVELERQRKQLTKKLQELNLYKDEFMAMASHELKTPLTVIKANLQILENKMHDDPKAQFVHKTLKQVNKLSSLISDLLDVSKIQAGKLDLNLSRFDIVPFLKEMIENIQQTTTEHVIHFHTKVNSIITNADRDRMEQVVINLLNNAIKYSPNGKDIYVDAAVQDKRVIVSVKDNGIGISEEDIDKIFTRFFRVRGVASTFSGSGIGLYISSEIIKRHGGEIWVESENDRGSTFYFTLPVVEGL